MSDTLRFEPNVPVEVALVYGQGKIITTEFGQRVMYTLVGGKVMFLDLGTAELVNRLQVKARQNFFVCKYQQRRGQLDQWRVWLPDQAIGEQPNGTFAVPALSPTPQSAASVQPPAAATAATSGTTRQPLCNGNGSKANGNGRAPLPHGRAQFLLDRTNDLVDVYAAALHYAQGKYGDRIRPEDVRGLLMAAVEQVRHDG